MDQFLAARLSEYPSITENLRYQITGFAIVLCALALLWLLLTMVGKLFTGRAEPAKPQNDTSPLRIPGPASSQTASPPSPGKNLEHPGDELAVIVASVAAMVRTPHRIVSVHEVTPLGPELLAVIAATIHTLIRTPHRIVSAKRVVASSPTSWYPNAWSAEGRRDIFESHHVR